MYAASYYSNIIYFNFPSDRSWARRARGGKKRPDLLNTDFTNDRERTASPSPVIESKPLLPTPEEETKPR